ncbi:MAG TPA: hypothetical protein PLJ52_11820, partial [Tenuifilaceae bacterium]|nr:hypothetical protein [Tenuifilaceae bacterium]
MRKLALIGFIVICAVAKGQTNFLISKYFSSGNISEAIWIKVINNDTIYHGPYTSYYPEGKVMQEGFYYEGA